MTASAYLSEVSACFALVTATGPHGEDITVDEGMMRCLAILENLRTTDGTVYLIGNGGSRAIVEHAETDFLKACGLRAQVPAAIGVLTASSNDIDYSESYALALSVLMRPADVLVAVSSSGASANILSAVQVAREKHALVMTLSGFAPDNKLRQAGDLNFYVPSSDYGHVELTHAVLLHHMTDEVARG